VGNASALDSALLVVMWGALFGALQGVAICEAEELRLDAYMSYLRPVLAQVNGRVVDTVKRIEDRRFAGDEATLTTVDVHYVALRALLELCKERGIRHAVPDAFDQLLQAAIKAGHAHDDFAVVLVGFDGRQSAARGSYPSTAGNNQESRYVNTGSI
jgi:hypothetical protein